MRKKRKGNPITQLSEVRKNKEGADFEKTLRELPDDLLAVACRITSAEIASRLESRGR